MDPQKVLILAAAIFVISVYLMLFAMGFKSNARSYYVHKPVVSLRFYRRWLRR